MLPNFLAQIAFLPGESYECLARNYTNSYSNLVRKLHRFILVKIELFESNLFFLETFSKVKLLTYFPY